MYEKCFSFVMGTISLEGSPLMSSSINKLVSHTCSRRCLSLQKLPLKPLNSAICFFNSNEPISCYLLSCFDRFFFPKAHLIKSSTSRFSFLLNNSQSVNWLGASITSKNSLSCARLDIASHDQYVTPLFLWVMREELESSNTHYISTSKIFKGLSYCY